MIANVVPRICWRCGGPIEHVQIGLSDSYRCLACFAEQVHFANCGRSQAVDTKLAPFSLEEEEALRRHNQACRRRRLDRKHEKRAKQAAGLLPPPPDRSLHTEPPADAVAHAVELAEATFALMEKYR